MAAFNSSPLRVAVDLSRAVDASALLAVFTRGGGAGLKLVAELVLTTLTFDECGSTIRSSSTPMATQAAAAHTFKITPRERIEVT